MVGFGFPDALDGIEMIGWHVHFATTLEPDGGHVLEFELRDGVAHLDDATELRVELPLRPSTSTPRPSSIRTRCDGSSAMASADRRR